MVKLSPPVLYNLLMNIEKEVSLIKERNKRVEADKAWEVSKTRRIIVALFTYAVMVLIMDTIGTHDPAIDAIIPTLGFLLSTLSLPFLKNIWLNFIYKK